MSDNELSFAELTRRLYESKWLVMSVTMAATAAALAVALLSTPIFKAEVLLVPVEHDSSGGRGLSSQIGGLASLAGVSLGGKSGDDAEAIAMLKSRLLTYSLIKERNLLPLLFPKKWDQAQHRWKDNVKVPTLWDAERIFSKSVRQILDDKKTGLVTVSVEWTDPTLAADWVTELVNSTNRLLRARAIEHAEVNIAFLKTQLDQTSVIEVRQSIYRLLEDEIKKVMLAHGDSEYAFKVLDPAVVPEEKIRPARGIIVGLGFFLGFGVSCVIAVLISTKRYREPAA
ncbi:Wzz/FepE/Etk N-terminal domain-containing protein [Hydrocarboniphaga sp.]|uniref:Wzz/FepE/Etk N-terminal domain-containing protein n=1 Tax=Hydrocarboniphaga sp. TaxID=2033016 RepID=UPI003D0E4FF9